MIEVRGSTLHNFTLMVREALEVDQRLLCNSCLLCSGWETIRLLPFGWHRESSVTRTQLCASALSRIPGLCNECIRTVTDTRILQHAGLTADGLRGMRLMIYIGMLADRAEWDVDQRYQIPMELAATLDRYSIGDKDPTQWLKNAKATPLHQMIVQQREYCTLPSNILTYLLTCFSACPGPALPTPLESPGAAHSRAPRLRSGAAHCNLELPVEVRRCPLRYAACSCDPALPTAICSFATYSWRR